MLSYRYLALTVLLSVTRSGSPEILRGSSRLQKDATTSDMSKRLNMLGKLSLSFNSVKAFIEEADTSDATDLARLEEITSKMEDFDSGFKELESEMVDDGANSEEWAEFDTVLSGYSELVSAVGAKLEAQGVENVDEVNNISEMNLLSAVGSARESLDTAKEKSDLEDIVETLLFVVKETKKMESGEAKDKLEETINIMMEQVEDKKNAILEGYKPGSKWTEEEVLEWCVGQKGWRCKANILARIPKMWGKCSVIWPDMVYITNYDTTRIRVWVNSDGIVETAPKRG